MSSSQLPKYPPPPAMRRSDSRSSGISMDMNYLLSPHGAVKLMQIMFAILICGCIARGLCYYSCTGTNYSEIGAGGQHFVLFVVVVCLFTTFGFLILHFLHLYDHERLQRIHALPFTKIELIYSAFASLLYFGIFCIEAAYSSGHTRYNTYDHSAWIAAAVFIFFDLALYIANAALMWRDSEYTFAGLFPKQSELDRSSASSPSGVVVHSEPPIGSKHQPQNMVFAESPTFVPAYDIKPGRPAVAYATYNMPPVRQPPPPPQPVSPLGFKQAAV